jgi:hypothetical protein
VVGANETSGFLGGRRTEKKYSIWILFSFSGPIFKCFRSEMGYKSFFQKMKEKKREKREKVLHGSQFKLSPSKFTISAYDYKSCI